MSTIFHQNREEDFAIRFRFPQGRPAYPWTAVFSTGRNENYIASFDGEKYVHALPEDGNAEYVRIEFNNHRLNVGKLSCSLYEEVPDAFFSDGSRRRVLPVCLPIELCDGPSDDASPTPEFEIIARSLVRGYSTYEIALQNGFVGTEAEWLEAQKGKDGAGVPTGGAPGQVLTKTGSGDNATAWRTPTGGGGGGTIPFDLGFGWKHHGAYLANDVDDWDTVPSGIVADEPSESLYIVCCGAVYRYNLSQQRILWKFKAPAPSLLNSINRLSGISTFVRDGYLYVFRGTMTKPVVHKIDISTGQEVASIVLTGAYDNCMYAFPEQALMWWSDYYNAVIYAGYNLVAALDFEQGTCRNIWIDPTTTGALYSISPTLLPNGKLLFFARTDYCYCDANEQITTRGAAPAVTPEARGSVRPVISNLYSGPSSEQVLVANGLNSFSIWDVVTNKLIPFDTKYVAYGTYACYQRKFWLGSMRVNGNQVSATVFQLPLTAYMPRVNSSATSYLQDLQKRVQIGFNLDVYNEGLFFTCVAAYEGFQYYRSIIRINSY